MNRKQLFRSVAGIILLSILSCGDTTNNYYPEGEGTQPEDNGPGSGSQSSQNSGDSGNYFDDCYALGFTRNDYALITGSNGSEQFRGPSGHVSIHQSGCHFTLYDSKYQIEYRLVADGGRTESEIPLKFIVLHRELSLGILQGGYYTARTIANSYGRPSLEISFRLRLNIGSFQPVVLLKLLIHSSGYGSYRSFYSSLRSIELIEGTEAMGVPLPALALEGGNLVFKTLMPLLLANFDVAYNVSDY